MKKALRYWWMFIIVLVIVPTAFVFRLVPRGQGWTHEWRWLSPSEFRFVRADTLRMESNGATTTGAFRGENLSIGVFAITSELPISPDLSSPEIPALLKAMVKGLPNQGPGMALVSMER